MQHNKYNKVHRLGKQETEGILQSGILRYEEKLDGSNGSFRLQDGEIVASSHNRVLDCTSAGDNRGFCKWVQANVNKDLISEGLEFYGEWLCLSGDTKIRLLSGGKRGHIMTLRDMYKYSTEKVSEKSKHKKKDGTFSYVEREPWWERYGYPQIFSLFIDDDCIKPQKVSKIIHSGDKEVYKVTTRKGKEIKSTLEHKFWTNNGWKQLKDIQVGDVVGVTDLVNYREPRKYGKGTRSIRLLFDELKQNNVCSECGIDNSLEVHHKDGDWKNNNLDNLQVLCKECHSKKHNNVSISNVEYDYTFDKIISIEYVGIEDCYDISMGSAENSASFVADGFVVHNCSHTVQYDQENYGRFYLYDILDLETNLFLGADVVDEYAKILGLARLEPLYVGEYQGADHLKSIAEQVSKLGQNQMEGIVIKNYDFRNRYGRQVHAKYVNIAFAETKQVRAVKIQDFDNENNIIERFVTEARVRKAIDKAVELHNAEMDMTLMKYVPKFIVDDVFAEESYAMCTEYDIVNFKALKRMIPKRWQYYCNYIYNQ